MGKAFWRVLWVPHVQAFLRPFARTSARVAEGNRMVRAYIYDWDSHLSQNNHMVNAEVETPLGIEQDSHKEEEHTDETRHSPPQGV